MNPEPATRIHQHAIKAWTISAMLYGLIWFVPFGLYEGFIIGNNLSSARLWYSGIDWILASVFFFLSITMYLLTVIAFPKLRWRRWKYDVSEREIDMQRGIIIKKRTLVPINRVQHVDTRQGPIYRNFGLSSVTISTAATTHEIPALKDDTASELRETISALVRRVKEDV